MRQPWCTHNDIYTTAPSPTAQCGKGAGLHASYLGEEVAEGYVRKTVQVTVQSKAHEKASPGGRGLQLFRQVAQHPRSIQLAAREEHDTAAGLLYVRTCLMAPPTLERLGVILNPAATPLWKDGHVDMPSGTAMRSKLMVVFLNTQTQEQDECRQTQHKEGGACLVC